MLRRRPTLCIVSDRQIDNLKTGAENRIIGFARYMSRSEVNVILVDSGRKRFFKFNDGVMSESFLPDSVIVKLLSPSRRVFSKIISSLARIDEAESWLIAESLDFGLFAFLFRLGLFEHIDALQTEFPWTVLPSLAVKKILCIKRIVLDEHNIETVRFQRFQIKNRASIIFLSIERFAVSVVSNVFVVSSADARILQTWKVPIKKIVVVPNCVETDVFNPEINPDRVLKEINATSIVIFFHGNLTYLPNVEAVDYIVRFLAPKIAQKFPSAKFLIVGPNPPAFQQANVIFTGYVDNLAEYIAAADLAVVPLRNGGGTRIKILEYMACGKPIVSTFIGAEGLEVENNKEIILEDDLSGSFVEKVMALIENKKLRKALGENARRKVIAKYDWYTACHEAKTYLF